MPVAQYVGGIDPAGDRDDAVLVVREYTRDTLQIRIVDPAGVRFTRGAYGRLVSAVIHADLPTREHSKRRLVERLQRQRARPGLRTQWERRPSGHRGVWWRE